MLFTKNYVNWLTFHRVIQTKSEYQNVSILNFIETRMTEVVVTSGHAKLQSDRHHQHNTQHFYRLDALPLAQPTVSEH